MPPHTSLKMVAVILAGGLSSRMGKDKALLPYKGERLIDFIVAILVDLGLQIYVSGQVESFECIPDRVPLLGPMGGVISSIDFLLSRSVDAALFVPVDMPRLSKALLKPLIDFQGTCDALTYEHHPLPLRLSFSENMYNKLDIFKSSMPSRGSINGFLKTLDTASLIPLDDQKICLQSTNTPEDWLLFKESICNEH